MKKIILITGAAGMVGTNLIERYINKNNTIIAIDSLKLGKLKFLRKFLKKKNFFFFKIDLSKKINNNKLSKILNNNNLNEIWHLAANSDIQKGIKNYQVDFRDTYLTTKNILNFIKNNLSKKSKFIFSSSSAVYGIVKGSIDENYKKKKPISNYGLMKLRSENYIIDFSKKNNLLSFIFRFPNVVGKNLTHGIIFDFVKKIKNNKKKLNVLGNGEQQKPYSDVLEIIKCMIFLKNLSYKNQTNLFNIGTNDKGIKVKDIVNIFLKNLDFKFEPIYQNKKQGWSGDVTSYRYSTKKINKLGFKFKFTSKQVIEKNVKRHLKI